MSDFFLQLSGNPHARRVIRTLGLPVPLPPRLERTAAPLTEEPLAGQTVCLGAQNDARGKALKKALLAAGANIAFAGDRAAFAGLKGKSDESFELAGADAGPFKALVFDASALGSSADLEQLRAFFNPVLRRVQSSGRIVVIGLPAETAETPMIAAARQALDGFVRSLAKEVGKTGVTANLLVVPEGAESRMAGPLRFFLTPASAYVSGQPLFLNGAGSFKEGPFTQPLAGKTALVTGSARGIGAETARVLAREGARVLILDRPSEADAANALAAEIGGAAILLDLGGSNSEDRLSEAVLAEGGLDILVHNAGVTRDKKLANMKQELWDLTLKVNLEAVIQHTSRLLEDKAIRNGGRIICLSSTSGLSGNMGQTNYAASKAGIIGYVRALAPQLARRKITVNAIAPGFIETQMTAAMPAAIREVARRLNSLSQGGRPVDVGEAVTFLATPNAEAVTGQVLRVCGQALVGA